MIKIFADYDDISDFSNEAANLFLLAMGNENFYNECQIPISLGDFSRNLIGTYYDEYWHKLS